MIKNKVVFEGETYYLVPPDVIDNSPALYFNGERYSKTKYEPYKIMSFRLEDNQIFSVDYKEQPNYLYTEENLIKEGFPIHSILRVSDNQIFSVGDIVHTTLNLVSPIKEINKKDDEIFAVIERDEYRTAVPFSVITSPYIKFKTYDDVEIDDPEAIIYGVCTKSTWQCSNITLKILRKKSGDSSFGFKSPTWLFFSTDKARNEYIEFNKPIYSLKKFHEVLSKKVDLKLLESLMLDFKRKDD